MTFIQVDEYALAIVVWVLSAMVLFAKAVHWTGFPNHRIISRITRIVLLVLAIAFVPVSVVWTQAKRGDKLWTALITVHKTPESAQLKPEAKHDMVMPVPRPPSSSEPTLPSKPSLDIAKTRQSPVSPLEGLRSLGWTVVSEPKYRTRFQWQERGPLPDIRSSLKYFVLISDDFAVSFLSPTSLNGLCALNGLEHLTDLTIYGHNLTGFSEVGCMSHITRLELGSFPSTSLEPIRRLSQLRELQLSIDPNKPLDITALESLGKLEQLWVNQVIVPGALPVPLDIAALRGIASLRSVSFVGPFVPDPSPLGTLPQLEELRIDTRSLGGFEKLANSPLKKLTILHVYGNPSPIDISQLGYLQHLSVLDLSAYGEVTLSPLRKRAGLSDLTITGLGLTFADMGRLLELHDPGAIASLRGLTKLGLAMVNIHDCNFLVGLEGLESIYINQSPIVDISALGSIRSLQSVQLAGTNIVDISPLLNLTKLRTLTIQSTPARVDIITELRHRGVEIRE